MTSVGLMRLVEQRRIDLAAPIQQYMEEFPDKNAVIRIRDLAGHLSGIRNYRGNEALSTYHHTGYRSHLRVFEDDPLIAPPGTKFVYSGYNWVLIEAAIARTADQSFPVFMQNAVLGPIGMTHTRAEIHGEEFPKSARFYEVDAEGSFVLGPPIDPGFAWAVGGYLSTAHDLAIFGSALLQPGVLTSQSLEALFRSQKTLDGSPTGYGIGWYVYERPRVFYHTGWTVGGLSALLILPDERLVVALVTNRGALNVRDGDPHSLSLDSIAFEIGKVFVKRSKQ
jgi:CubicO group peptidase (beta-lactamase class C family)